VTFVAKEWLLESPESSAWVQAYVLGDRAELRLGDRHGSAALVAPLDEFASGIDRLQTLLSGLREAIAPSSLRNAYLCYLTACVALSVTNRRAVPWEHLSEIARSAWEGLHQDLEYLSGEEVMWYYEQTQSDPTLSAFVMAFYYMRFDVHANANARSSDPR